MAGVGAPLATAFVRVQPDTKGFGERLKAQVTRSVGPAAKAVDEGLIRRLSQQVDDANRRVAKSNLDVRASELALTAARAKLKTVTDDAAASDEAKAKASLTVERAELRNASAVAATAKAQDAARRSSEALTRARAGETDGARRSSAATRDLGRQLSQGIDLKQFSTFAQRLRDIRTIGAATIAPIRNFSTQIAKLAVVAGAGSAALLGGTGLVGGVLALAGSLTQVTGALPLIAPALAQISVIEGTVKVATLGVAKALGKVLAPITKTLSVNAQQFVGEFRKLVPALTAAKNAVQDAAFAGLAKDVRGLAERFLPQLTANATALAATLNGAVRRSLRAVNTSATESTIALVFQHAQLAVQDFTPNLVRLPGLLLGVVNAAAPALRNLFLSANGALSHLLDRLRSSIATGQLTATLERGVTALTHVGAIAAHVFTILRELVRGASEAVGGDLLKSIADVTGKFVAFLKSFQGQKALDAIFAAALPVLSHLGALLGLVGPQLAKLAPVVVNLADAFITGLRPVIPVAGALLATLGTALASVLPAVSTVAVAFGQALTGAIRILQPVIAPLAAALAGLLSPTGLLASALNALAPVLPILAAGLGRVVGQLARGLVAALDAVAPVVPALAAAFADLAVAVAKGLGDALTQIAPQLPALVVSLTGFLTAVTPLVPQILALLPPLIRLGTETLPPLLDVITRLLPAFTSFSRLNLGSLGAAVGVLATVAGLLTRALSGLVGVITGTVLPAIGAFAASIGPGLATAWRAVVTGVTTAFTAVRSAVVTALGAISGAVQAAFQFIAGVVAVGLGIFASIGRVITTLVSPFQTTFALLAAIVNLAFQVIKVVVFETLLGIVTAFRVQFGVMRAIWAGAWAAITAVTGAALAVVRNVVGTNLAAVRAVVTGVVAAARAVWTAFWQGTLGAAVRAGVGAVLAAVRAIAGIVGIAAGAAARFVGAIVGGVGRARSGVASAIGGIIGLVSSIGSQILNALGDLGGLLFSAGSRIIGGLISGITSRIRDVAGAISRIAGTIRAALPFSPAKVGPLSGRGSPEIAGRKISQMIQSGLDSQPISLSRALSGVGAATGIGGGGAAAGGGAGVTADVLRAALEGMAIRFDGDGLARLVSNRQTRMIATGSRT